MSRPDALRRRAPVRLRDDIGQENVFDRGDAILQHQLALLQSREITPTLWFIHACDEKFTTEDLSGEGNSFATSYYGSGEGLHSSAGSYLDDYCKAFPSAESLYHVDDSWASFDALSPRITSRLEAWRKRLG